MTQPLFNSPYFGKYPSTYTVQVKIEIPSTSSIRRFRYIMVGPFSSSFDGINAIHAAAQVVPNGEAYQITSSVSTVLR